MIPIFVSHNLMQKMMYTLGTILDAAMIVGVVFAGLCMLAVIVAICVSHDEP